MPEILFPAYRDYDASRVEVNDAMAALLVGSRLAGHTLSLTAGSTATLGQLFPGVEHIDRFNMRSDLARHFLNNADHHIASVAVPYALGTHEDFVMEMIKFLRTEGRTIVTHGHALKAWNMHNALFETCNKVEPAEWIEPFHVLREMRNCITHSGGEASQKLRDAVAAMGADARLNWQRLNHGAEPEDVENADGRLTLTAEHVFTAFAVTKRLGRDINSLLAGEFNGLTWAKVAVSDFASGTPKVKNSSSWRRSLIGYARQYYSASPLTEADLEVAARQLNLWAPMRWS